MRDKQMQDIHVECEALLKQFDKQTSNVKQAEIISQLKDYVKDFEGAFDYSQIEMGDLESQPGGLELRQRYTKKNRELKKLFQQVKKDIQWKESKIVKADLFGDSAERYGNEVDPDSKEGRLQQAREQMQDSKTSLARTLHLTGQITDTGRDIVVKLDEDTERLEKIFNDLSEMEQILDRSKRVLTNIARSMKTDGYLWCLIGLVFFAVLGIIGYEVFAKKNDPVASSL